MYDVNKCSVNALKIRLKAYCALNSNEVQWIEKLNSINYKTEY